MPVGQRAIPIASYTGQNIIFRDGEGDSPGVMLPQPPPRRSKTQKSMMPITRSGCRVVSAPTSPGGVNWPGSAPPRTDIPKEFAIRKPPVGNADLALSVLRNQNGTQLKVQYLRNGKNISRIGYQIQTRPKVEMSKSKRP